MVVLLIIHQKKKIIDVNSNVEGNSSGGSHTTGDVPSVNPPNPGSGYTDEEEDIEYYQYYFKNDFTFELNNDDIDNIRYCVSEYDYEKDAIEITDMSDYTTSLQDYCIKSKDVPDYYVLYIPEFEEYHDVTEYYVKVPIELFLCMHENPRELTVYIDGNIYECFPDTCFAYLDSTMDNEESHNCYRYEYDDPVPIEAVSTYNILSVLYIMPMKEMLDHAVLYS